MKKFPLSVQLTSLLLSAALVFSSHLHAGTLVLEQVDPQDVGLRADGIDDLQAGMRKAVDDGSLAGIVSALVRDNKLVFLDAYGHQDLENDVAMSEDTIFRIFSMTKPITGAALMMLYDEGKFELDDPVSQYIPELHGLEVAVEDGPGGFPITEPADHEMTIRELMSHTGGLTYGMFSRSQVDSQYVAADVLNADGTLKDMIDKLARIPLRQQPGSQWHYSVSVDVQGYLVEVLSGVPFEEFLETRLFQPLGMVDTGFHVPEEKRDRFATMYQSGQGGLTVQDGFGGDYQSPVTFPSGGGGLASTISDYLKFTQMLASGGELNGARILSPESVRIMRTTQLPDGMNEIPGYPGNQFGVDFAIVTDSARNDGMSRGSYWWWGIGGTWFWIDPVENLTFVGMIQNRNLAYARQLQSISKRLVYNTLAESESE